MIKIGLTGGLAVVKSSVANFFLAEHIPVYNADKIVSTLYESPFIIKRIKKKLPEIINKNTIDKKKLSDLLIKHGFLLKFLVPVLYFLFHLNFQ